MWEMEIRNNKFSQQQGIKLKGFSLVTQVILKEEIKSQVFKILSGISFEERFSQAPRISILSPWISDVQLEINDNVIALDPEYFKTIYRIASVNFAHNLLLLRTAMGTKITIVTLPPTEEFYKNRSQYIIEFLDFLDEIGCDVFVNANLHAKLFISNDNAFVGSFNLSKAAFYDREEIGVSIDDIQNLKSLEAYFKEVALASEPYGFTAKLRSHKKHIDGWFGSIDSQRIEAINEKVTRGWLYEDIVRLYGRYDSYNMKNVAYDFLCEWMQIDPLYDDMLKQISSNINNFYFRAFSTFLKILPEESQEYLVYLKKRFGYDGKANEGEIFRFLSSMLARKTFPDRQMLLYSFKHPTEHN
jgi:hypothetical protein